MYGCTLAVGSENPGPLQKTGAAFNHLAISPDPTPIFNGC